MMKKGIDYNLVRYAEQERQAILWPSQSFHNQDPQIRDFITVSAHLYRGTYYPGTLYRADYQTRCAIYFDARNLYFDLEMEEPYIKKLLKRMKEEKNPDFWQTDFVSLNFIATDNKLVQIVFKPDASAKGFKNYQYLRQWQNFAKIKHTPNTWKAQVAVPLKILGFTYEDIYKYPILFDIVRYHSANAAITAWCPIPDQLPFNETYRYPVFCFGLLSAKPVHWEKYAGKSADLGKIVYKGPKRVKAGEYVGFDIKYRVGAKGFNQGGGIKFNISNEVIECDRNSPLKRRFPEKDWSRLQWDEPKQEGYVSISCSNKNARFKLFRRDYFSITAVLTRGGPLKEGDYITISAGIGEGCPGIRSQLLSQKNFPLKFYFDLLGNGVFLPLPKFPAIDIIGCPAKDIQIHCQPTPDPGERFRLVVVATDYYGNVADSYRGEVKFFSPAKVNGLPSKYRFKVSDRGIAEFRVSIESRGVYTIEAVDARDAAISGKSNLIVTDGSFGPDKIFFGDIHTHSQLSDGRLHPFQKYREVALHRGCDFWALTDHGHDLTTKRISLLNETMEKFNKEGWFVTLPGYEWTGTLGQGEAWLRKMYGHRNVIFLHPLKYVFDGINPWSDTPEKLKEALRKTDGDFIIINHFHCGDPATFKGVDESVEISGWCGNDIRETPLDMVEHPAASVQSILSKGFRVGIFAGSDHGTEAYYRGLPAELTGLYCKELCRNDIFKSLKEGKGYATSGQKTLLKFTLNGIEPSNSKGVARGRKRRLKIVAGSVMPVLTVEVIKNGNVWMNLGSFDFGVESFSIMDDAPSPNRGYYYVRIKTAQGHTAWSSPVFYRVR